MAQEENEEDFPGRLLHQAALWGNAELLEDLLHGEMIQFLNAKDSRGRTALHAAATNENETCTRILLQAGADPNIACGLKEQFKTALHIAAESGQLETCRLLLEHDADLLAKDSSGLTAMDLAEKAEHPHVMELLKKAAKPLLLLLTQPDDVTRTKWRFRGVSDSIDGRQNSKPSYFISHGSSC